MKKTYGTYKGRSTLTDKLRVLAVVLLILVVLAAAAVFAAQDYIVYTEDGPRLQLPGFLRQDPPEDQPPAPPEPGDISVVIEPPEDPPEEEEAWLRAAALPIEAVAQGTLASQAAEYGANAVILDMKTDQGRLNFVSQQAVAAQVGANSSLEGINDQLRAAAEGDLYLIARMSCFRDHRVGTENAYAITTNPGRRWTDLGGVRWSSPASQAVRDYLVGVMTELAELGFDEILLEYSGYPTAADGHLEYIRRGDAYPADGLNEIVAEFFRQAAQALAEYDVRLSVCATREALEGGDRSGREAAQLEGLNGNIWMAEGQGGAAALEQAGVQDTGRLVEIVPALDPERGVHQAVFPEGQ